MKKKSGGSWSDKTHKRQIKRLRALQEKWLNPLGLKWWHRIEFLYEDDRSRFVLPGGIESVFMTRVDWARLWAEIECNLRLVSLLEDDELEHCLVHELMHLMISEMATEKRKDHEERVCTQLAQAFVWARDWDKGSR